MRSSEDCFLRDSTQKLWSTGSELHPELAAKLGKV